MAGLKIKTSGLKWRTSRENSIIQGTGIAANAATGADSADDAESADTADSNSEKSVSYQKKDGRGHARPSFFWYDNDKDLEVCFLMTGVKWLEENKLLKYEIAFWQQFLLPCILNFLPCKLAVWFHALVNLPIV